MLISVIIPTCNRNDLLSKCLDMLAPVIQKTSFEYEVIVTDDSKDRAAQSLINENYVWAKWVEGPRKGPAANRNNGAKSSNGQWIVFIDDDCVPDNMLMNNYFQAITQNKHIGVFEGCIKVDRVKKSFIEESPVNEEGGHLWSCNFMINKEIFFELSGFDENFPFPAMEDVELHYRICQKNFKIVFVKNAFVIHPWRTQKRMYYVTQQRFGSLIYFLEKHPEQTKKINTLYYLRLTFAGIKELVTHCFIYKFKGVGGKIIWVYLHFCFALHFVFNNSGKRKIYV